MKRVALLLLAGLWALRRVARESWASTTHPGRPRWLAIPLRTTGHYEPSYAPTEDDYGGPDPYPLMPDPYVVAIYREQAT